VTLVMYVPPKNASSSPAGHHSIRQWVLQGPVPKWNKCSKLLIQRWNCILRPVPPRNMWIPVRHHAIRDHGCVLPGSVQVLVRYWLLNVPAATGIWYRYVVLLTTFIPVPSCYGVQGWFRWYGIWYRYGVLLTTFIPVSSCYGVQDWFFVDIRQIYMWYWDLYKTGRRLRYYLKYPPDYYWYKGWYCLSSYQTVWLLATRVDTRHCKPIYLQ
jgi:hypothetical protein